ncbi:MAG TPA: hypothetical protein VGN51_24050 [Acidimicrobiia bacterium]|jgi:phosphate/sulfate permease
MRVMRFGLAVVLALGAGFLLVGPLLVLVIGALDSSAPTDLPADWPVMVGGIAIGAGLLVASTRLVTTDPGDDQPMTSPARSTTTKTRPSSECAMPTPAKV